MVSSNSCFEYSLQKDWAEFGSAAFTFEILETLEKKTDQSQDSFLDDLNMLKEMWSLKLDASKRY